ncbi:MAG TPA: hypothetical protein VJM09_03320 [Sphingobium sp.]|nr:hypothetical protein [Sphingobium sp.]
MTRSALTFGAAFAAVTSASIGNAASTQAQTPDLGNYVAMEEIGVPIVDAGRVGGTLRLSIVLQARDVQGAINLAGRKPELRAALLGAASEFARLHASPFAPVDAGKLAAALTPALRGVDPSITRVLIVKVFAMAA